MAVTLTERVVRQERWVIAAALALITLMSWLYILSGAGTGMSAVAMTTWEFPPRIPLSLYTSEWNIAYASIMLLMWWIMMIAMMMPSAAPMILLYARVARKAPQAAPQSNVVATANFAVGYVTVWLLFSVAAVLLQWLLERIGILHGMMMWSTSAILSAVLLIGAGLYQFSSLKSVCLRHCRSPVEFISSHWRAGHFGAFRMGLEHGIFCVGCCWSLMVLLFVGGAMNLIWIAGLAVLVLVEKLFPKVKMIIYLSGAGLIVSGIFLLFSAAI